jgi:hypothetical protein
MRKLIAVVLNKTLKKDNMVMADAPDLSNMNRSDPLT